MSDKEIRYRPIPIEVGQPLMESLHPVMAVIGTCISHTWSYESTGSVDPQGNLDRLITEAMTQALKEHDKTHCIESPLLTVTIGIHRFDYIP